MFDFFFKIGNLVNISVKCHQRRDPRGEAVIRQRGCLPRPGVRSQQAAGVEELVVGVEDPLEMSDTEQGDIGLETQQDSDLSDEDTQADGGDTEMQGQRQGQG